MARMTEHDMIGWFNAAPMGSRQQRMLWVAHKMTDQAAKRGQLIRHLEEALALADDTPARAPVLRNLTKHWLKLALELERTQASPDEREPKPKGR